MRLTHLISRIRSLPIKRIDFSDFCRLIKLNSLRVSQMSFDVSANLRDCTKANYDSSARLKEKLNCEKISRE